MTVPRTGVWRGQAKAGVAGRYRLSCGGVLMLAVAVLLAGCVTEGGDLPGVKPDMARAAQLNTQLGVDYARKGYYTLAQKKFERAISQRQDYAPAHAGLGFVYSRLGQMDKAEQEYRKALSLNPDDPETQNNFGTFLCAQDKGEQAQRHFQLALANSAYATPAAGWTNAGVCALHMKQADKAAQYFEHALKINPGFAQAVRELAILSYHKGQYQRARALEKHYATLVTPGPEMLLLSAHTERALGHEARARAFEVQLIQTYPQSHQAAKISELQQ
ncbi:MAG: type IV pilus biogenesis/stability protein PilW [Sinobacteraceae bacterium]|nr:type IV pilus biogenesis/stability protein PilW [Nevskiaceae bacterium]